MRPVPLRLSCHCSSCVSRVMSVLIPDSLREEVIPRMRFNYFAPTGRLLVMNELNNA